jgi:hypothetical protein
VDTLGVEQPLGGVEQPRASGGSIVRLTLLASIAISFLAASAAPTPLYQRYDEIWHGTALTTTEAFGVYAAAVLGGLLVLGGAATHIGRRPVLLAALGLQGSIRTTVPLAEPHERAGLLAAVYLVCYALGVILLGAGAFALLGRRA